VTLENQEHKKRTGENEPKNILTNNMNMYVMDAQKNEKK